ncbi:hypothetical protein LQV63_27380 [Paenibacillus profundus]|uniref:CdiI immunity protein domain-containing protein n=1 Tax=Paenibacillus profundus TaxID=1173085 RepID=A0ABS8YTM8_9BACL|nr:hypothetical protein [Paenibacillus profundus]MCE5172989.1 hypothetical protein [Paenibacillus profundus]
MMKVESLDYLLDTIHGDLFFERVFSSELDWDDLLDRRDAGEFDENWTVNNELLKTVDVKMFSDSEIDRLREFVFKKVFAITQHSELAGYVSDDFGLIGEAVQRNAFRPWVRGLMNHYIEGKFPTSSREDEDETHE